MAREAVLDVLRDRYLVKVLTVPHTLAYHQGMVDRAFAFTYAIQLLVVVVTLAGIVDLLTTQVIERRWEIGALRLIGAEEHTVSASIVLEGLVIGATGALLGVMLSVGTSLLWVHVNFRILIGYILEHHFAALTALWCVALATGVAVLAALVASRRALRQPILRRWREELWLEERRLERQRDLPGAESAGSASDSTVGTMHALETPRLGHLAADLEFLDDLRGTLEVASSTPVRQDQDAMPRPAIARLEARRQVARSRRAPARRQTRTRRSGKGRDQGER